MSGAYNKAIAIIITVLMLGSSLAYMFYQFFAPPEEEPLPVQDLNTDTVYYRAESVPVTVTSVHDSVLVFADTNETDLEKINSSLKALEGFSIVNASFRPGPERLMYLAELSLKGISPEQSITFLEENLPSLLSDPAFTLIGSVQAPEQVSLKQVETGEERRQSFEALRAFLNPGTVPGDELLATMYVTFKGPLPIETNVIEAENLSSKPGYGSKQSSFELLLLEPSLTVSGTVQASSYIDSNSLNLVIENLPRVERSLLEVSPNSLMLYLSSEEKNVDRLSDLDSFIRSLPATIESLSLDPFSGSLSFDSGQSLKESRQAIQSKALELGLNILAEEAVSFVDGSILFSEQELDNNSIPLALVQNIENALTANSLEYELSQPGLFSIGSLSLDVNLSFDQNSFYGLTVPGHDIGEEIVIEVKYFHVREDASVYEATEV